MPVNTAWLLQQALKDQVCATMRMCDKVQGCLPMQVSLYWWWNMAGVWVGEKGKRWGREEDRLGKVGRQVLWRQCLPNPNPLPGPDPFTGQHRPFPMCRPHWSMVAALTYPRTSEQVFPNSKEISTYQNSSTGFDKCHQATALSNRSLGLGYYHRRGPTEKLILQSLRPLS